MTGLFYGHRSESRSYLIHGKAVAIATLKPLPIKTTQPDFPSRPFTSATTGKRGLDLAAPLCLFGRLACPQGRRHIAGARLEGTLGHPGAAQQFEQGRFGRHELAVLLGGNVFEL